MHFPLDEQKMYCASPYVLPVDTDFVLKVMKYRYLRIFYRKQLKQTLLINRIHHSAKLRPVGAAVPGVLLREKEVGMNHFV